MLEIAVSRVNFGLFPEKKVNINQNLSDGGLEGHGRSFF